MRKKTPETRERRLLRDGYGNSYVVQDEQQVWRYAYTDCGLDPSSDVDWRIEHRAAIRMPSGALASPLELTEAAQERRAEMIAADTQAASHDKAARANLRHLGVVAVAL